MDTDDNLVTVGEEAAGGGRGCGRGIDANGKNMIQKENKIKRINFLILHPTLIFEEQLQPGTC